MHLVCSEGNKRHANHILRPFSGRRNEALLLAPGLGLAMHLSGAQVSQLDGLSAATREDHPTWVMLTLACLL